MEPGEAAGCRAPVPVQVGAAAAMPGSQPRRDPPLCLNWAGVCAKHADNHGPPVSYSGHPGAELAAGACRRSGTGGGGGGGGGGLTTRPAAGAAHAPGCARAGAAGMHVPSLLPGVTLQQASRQRSRGALHRQLARPTRRPARLALPTPPRRRSCISSASRSASRPPAGPPLPAADRAAGPAGNHQVRNVWLCTSPLRSHYEEGVCVEQ